MKGPLNKQIDFFLGNDTCIIRTNDLYTTIPFPIFLNQKDVRT